LKAGLCVVILLIPAFVDAQTSTDASTSTGTTTAVATTTTATAAAAGAATATTAASAAAATTVTTTAAATTTTTPTTTTTTTTLPPGVNIMCYACTGTYGVCTSAADNGTATYCPGNVTTCTIGKITNTAAGSVLWGRGCGPANFKTAELAVCQPYLAASGASGQLCTCTTSGCNSAAAGTGLITRAELGLSGTGIQCRLCTGGGAGQYLCSGGAADDGLSVDCGTGVATCRLAITSNGTVARACGTKGALPAPAACQLSAAGTVVCTCPVALCNSVAGTPALLALTTTKAPTTTSPPTISPLSLIQLASLLAQAVLNASLATTTTAGGTTDNSTATPATTTTSVSLSQLVAGNLPAGMAGQCAYLLSGQVEESILCREQSKNPNSFFT
jgi:hypothetical protein